MNGVEPPDKASNVEEMPIENDGRVRTVGLLGGSFNPPHHGHLAVSRACKKMCHLDKVAWLITPHNPLKDPSIYMPLKERITLIQEMIQDDPDIFVWDIEKMLQTSESIQTVTIIQNLYPSMRFIWLMGADLLIELPLWPTWESFLKTIPVAVYPRPSFTQAAKECAAAQTYANVFIEAQNAPTLPFQQPPSLVFLSGEEYDISSTIIRKDQKNNNHQQM